MKPFEGGKALYHVDYWSQMQNGIIPPPVLVTLDPISRCQLRCSWCNSATKLGQCSDKYSDDIIEQLPQVLGAWSVKAVCIAGGGEPTLHPGLSELIMGLLRRDVDVGVVTNGIGISRHTDALRNCKWVGVSVDAGSSEVYSKAKGVDAFGKVIGEIKNLRASSRTLEITYKYLVHPSNIRDIRTAAHTAKVIGCNYFHARPACPTWTEREKTYFNKSEIVEAVEVLNGCKRWLNDESFEVVATTDKVSDSWGTHHPFETCHAVGMTAVIGPDQTVGLCCDRRGDDRLTLGKFERPHEIVDMWNSDNHWRLMNSICVDDCPRCTYAKHNQLYEQFNDERDLVCKWFI